VKAKQLHFFFWGGVGVQVFFGRGGGMGGGYVGIDVRRGEGMGVDVRMELRWGRNDGRRFWRLGFSV
jgi:hypothetical protein